MDTSQKYRLGSHQKRRSCSRSRSRSNNREDARYDKYSRSSSSDRTSKKRKKSKTSRQKKIQKLQQKAREVDAKVMLHASEQISPKQQPSQARVEEGTRVTEIQPQKSDPMRDFFAKLKEQENAKDRVGTIHATGRKPESATSLSVSDNWECVKAGCGNSNMKRATSCTKCGAMRRISAWR
jgi:hypothetical protein